MGARKTPRATLLAMVLLAAAGGAQALTVKGRVVNGTTGKDAQARVVIVNPAAGMLQEQSAETSDGRFSLEVEGGAGMYLVRVDYDGVSYTQPIQDIRGDEAEVTVTVYDATTSWDGVQVAIPHIAARSHGDHLQIERLYEVTNASDPPRAVTGTGAAFRIALPDVTELPEVQVTATGVPVRRMPVETDVPGVYRIDYPVRPGVTQYALSYTVPYPDSGYTLAERALYDYAHMTVYAVNEGMAVSARGVELHEHEAAHGMTAYLGGSVGEGTDLAITFTGGVPESPSTAATGEPSVFSIPNDMQAASVLVMVVLLLALLAFIGVSQPGSHSPLDDPKQLRRWYDLVLKRLAKLDDLHEADTIPNEVYHLKRAELKNQLASLMLRLQHLDSGERKRAKSARAAARAAGTPPSSPAAEGR